MRLSNEELEELLQSDGWTVTVSGIAQELLFARKVIEAARYAEEPTGKIFFGDVNNEVENRRANFSKALKAYDAGAKE